MIQCAECSRPLDLTHDIWGELASSLVFTTTACWSQLDSDITVPTIVRFTTTVGVDCGGDELPLGMFSSDAYPPFDADDTVVTLGQVRLRLVDECVPEEVFTCMDGETQELGVLATPFITNSISRICEIEPGERVRVAAFECVDMCPCWKSTPVAWTTLTSLLARFARDSHIAVASLDDWVSTAEPDHRLGNLPQALQNAGFVSLEDGVFGAVISNVVRTLSTASAAVTLVKVR